MLPIALEPVIVAWQMFCVHIIFHQSADGACQVESSNAMYMQGQSCYEFNAQELTWMEAREYCHEQNGRLPSITGAGLQNWLSNTAAVLWPEKMSVWLGLNRFSIADVFVWDAYDTSAGNAVLYTYWAEGYPESVGKCVLMDRNHDWRWTTNSCWGPFSFRSSFVCEYDNPDAVDAVTTVSPNAHMNTINVSYTDLTDNEPAVDHKGLLYLALAAVASIGIIIFVFIGYTIVGFTKSRATRTSETVYL